MAPDPQTETDGFYRESLGELFIDCAEELASKSSDDIPDVTSLRSLQDELGEYISSARTPTDVRYTAFMIDLIIGDLFRNFFGDLIHSEEADQARRQLCQLLVPLFRNLSSSMRQPDKLAQMTVWQSFVSDYLQIVHRLNQHWAQEERTSGEA
jgi:hypothetical protein